MHSPTSSASSPTATSATPPLPLRTRGLLEIVDASVKLYRQYFWVLIGWSAIVTGGLVFSGFGYLIYPVIAPFIVGPSICVVAAAVRGQQVSFNNCWQFTQPRFFGMVVASLLTFIVSLVALIVLGTVCVLLFIGGIALIGSVPQQLQLVTGIVGFILLSLFATIAFTALFAWSSMVPIVACMEEDKRNASSLGRAWELLSGHWWRIISLMSLLSLGYLVLTGIIMATAAFLSGAVAGFQGLQEMFSGSGNWETVFWVMYLTFLFSQVVLGILWNPIQYLLTAMFYLDVRVRKEALDLEWTAHQNKPAVPPTAPPPAPSPAWDMATPGTGFVAASATPTASSMPPASPAMSPAATVRLDEPTPQTTPAPSAPDTYFADTPSISVLPDTASPTATTPAAPWAPSNGISESTPVTDPLLTDSTVNAPVTNTVVCPQCGTRVAANRDACDVCGTRLKPLW